MVKAKAVRLLLRAAAYWDKLCRITSSHYFEVPYVAGDSFSWEKYRPQVLLDIETACRAKQ